jgi:hypothetical protein
MASNGLTLTRSSSVRFAMRDQRPWCSSGSPDTPTTSTAVLNSRPHRTRHPGRPFRHGAAIEGAVVDRAVATYLEMGAVAGILEHGRGVAANEHRLAGVEAVMVVEVEPMGPFWDGARSDEARRKKGVTPRAAAQVEHPTAFQQRRERRAAAVEAPQHLVLDLRQGILDPRRQALVGAAASTGLEVGAAPQDGAVIIAQSGLIEVLFGHGDSSPMR